MASLQLDPHQKPPERLRRFYKYYQKLSLASLEKDSEVVDFSKEISQDAIRVVRYTNIPSLQSSFCENIASTECISGVPAYEHVDFPGLHIVPSLLSQNTQWSLLSSLLHRDLANNQHKTNIHAHYFMPYNLCVIGGQQAKDHNLAEIIDRPSFFNCSPDCQELFQPVDSKVHKPFTITQFLNKKLRWITLGGQYDWTKKVYPSEASPPFPKDISQLIQDSFPEVVPEAAIVNVYSPGDTLSLHRDVSEASSTGLVSISLGCDGIFIVGLDEQAGVDPRRLAIRLRSGDAVYMSGSSRYAWHGVAQILPGTCPTWLDSWPSSTNIIPLEILDETESIRYEAWRGWMKTKRVNLNVRQINLNSTVYDLSYKNKMLNED